LKGVEMHNTIKVSLLFFPLILFLIVLGVVVNDLRHPVVLHDRCRVVATGLPASAYRAKSLVLYQQSSDPVYNIALTCEVKQNLFVNDLQRHLVLAKAGQQASLKVLTYRYLPTRWMIGIAAKTPE
jgi:hypothetical protein